MVNNVPKFTWLVSSERGASEGPPTCRSLWSHPSQRCHRQVPVLLGSLLLVQFGRASQESPREAQMLGGSLQTEPSLVCRVRNGEVPAEPGAGCHL